MKKILLTLGIAGSLLIIPAVIMAETPTVNPTRAARRMALQATGTELRKERAFQEIDRRISALNAVITRIGGIKRLTDDQKSTLTSQVQAEITNLQNLRSKIEADTDPATLKTDKQSIVNSYRVYVLFIPKIQILAHADRIMNVADLMAGKTTDPTALSDINDAKTQAQNAMNAVLPLTPDGWPGNKTTLQSARTMLRTALKDLNNARPLIKVPTPTP